MTQDEIDAAGEMWQWVPSNTVWLDEDVSSDLYVPPYPFPITKNHRVSRIERVRGIPSQFPVPRVETAYLVDFSSTRDAYMDRDGKMLNLEKILKDKVRSLFPPYIWTLNIVRTVIPGTEPRESGRHIEPPQ